MFVLLLVVFIVKVLLFSVVGVFDRMFVLVFRFRFVGNVLVDMV